MGGKLPEFGGDGTGTMGRLDRAFVLASQVLNVGEKTRGGCEAALIAQ